MKKKANFIMLLALALASAAPAAKPGAPDQTARRQAEQTPLNLPLRFEENAGNFDPSVRFIARPPGYTLFLTATESVLTLPQTRTRAKGAGKASVVRISLEGASDAPTLRGENKLATLTNYFVGNDHARWRAANNFERVRFASVYPGVDLLYHAQQGGLEYDFEIAPGADPKRIALRYDGVRRLRVDERGSLVLQLKGGGELRQNRPVTYQVIDGVRRDVVSRYVARGKHSVTFQVGEYDPSERLVIDPPVLSYSTYLGGGGAETGYAIAVDAGGLVYVTGVTASTDFPTLGQYQTDQSFNDVFVAKLNPALSGVASLLYSTYLGGNGTDAGYGIAVDGAGNAFVTGETGSTNFPTLNQYQTDQPGVDAFVTKLDTNVTGAASLVYSTYLGGDGNDIAHGIAVGSAGNASVAGETTSPISRH